MFNYIDFTVNSFNLKVSFIIYKYLISSFFIKYKDKHKN